MSTALNILILAASCVLLVFWLHAACQALLGRQAETPLLVELSEVNELNYLTVRRTLESDPRMAGEPAAYLAAVERDYEALTYLLRNAATLRVGHFTARERLLLMDFQLLRVWVRLHQLVGLTGWQGRVLEMTHILNYFANTVSQRLEAFARSR
ncbi:MAG: hypothetical protein ACRD3I_12125 [Terriglobales bacterium]